MVLVDSATCCGGTSLKRALSAACSAALPLLLLALPAALISCLRSLVSFEGPAQVTNLLWL